MSVDVDFERFEASEPYGILVPKKPVFQKPMFEDVKPVVGILGSLWADLVTNAHGKVVKVPQTFGTQFSPWWKECGFGGLFTPQPTFHGHLFAHGPYYFDGYDRFSRPSWDDWELVAMCRSWQGYTPPILDHTAEKGWQN